MPTPPTSSAVLLAWLLRGQAALASGKRTMAVSKKLILAAEQALRSEGKL